MSYLPGKIFMMKKIRLSDYIIQDDDLELGEKIGQGGFSTVYKAIYKKTGQEVAVKFLKPQAFQSTLHHKHFFNEIFIPCCYQMDTIVKFIGFKLKSKVKKTKMPIIVTELVKNPNLRVINDKYLRNPTSVFGYGPLQRIKIIYGVAKTMEFIHSKGVIHRDLKLENILLTDNFEPKISDFGFAKEYIESITQTYNLGTVYYMAPELIKCEYDDPYDYKVDVYAFAIMLYFMFVPLRDFKMDDNKPIAQRDLFFFRVLDGHRPKRSSSIPDAYWELITKCWADDKNDRPTFSEIVAELKDDKYAFSENGISPNLDELHEYQNKLECLNDIQTLQMTGFSESTTHNFAKVQKRKTIFNWKYH